MFNNIWLFRYPRPRKVVFDNIYELKRDFITFLKEFDIKPVLMSVKNPQANALVERVHQVILNMLVTKDLDNKVFDYTDTWGETLAYKSWVIRAYYNRTIIATPGQVAFGKSILFD